MKSAISRTSCLTGMSTKIVFNHYPDEIITWKVTQTLTTHVMLLHRDLRIRLGKMEHIYFFWTAQFQSFWLIYLKSILSHHMIFCVRNFSSILHGQAELHQKLNHFYQHAVWNASWPHASRCTDTPEVVVLEVRYNHRARSRQSEMLAACQK